MKASYRVDWEALRIERGWPTPISMRRAAHALGILSLPRYGEILEYVADLCDASLGPDPLDGVTDEE